MGRDSGFIAAYSVLVDGHVNFCLIPEVPFTLERLRLVDKQLRGLDATSKAEDIENAVYDLKAVNPNRKADVDRRTPAELLDLIEAKGREVAQALAVLRNLTNSST